MLTTIAIRRALRDAGRRIFGVTAREQNLPGKNFCERTGRGDAELLTTHLLQGGDVRLGNQIEGGLVRQSEHYAYIRAVYRGADGRAGCGAKVDASGKQGLHRLDRLHEDKLHVQTFLSEKTSITCNHIGHIQDAARYVSDTNGREFAGFFSAPRELSCANEKC